MEKTIIIPVGPSIAYVPLSKDLFALIDVSDIELVDQYSWHAGFRRDTAYAACSTHKPRKMIYMHRLITNAPHGLEVDHKFGNTLDNRRSQLRLATRSQNAKNMKTPKHNNSGLKGVHWSKVMNKWGVRIGCDGTSKVIGYFSDKTLAHEAYKDASVRLHGEFGRAS